MKPSLETLLRHPGIWRGDRLGEAAPPGIPSGLAELDALLPGGGWPRGALTELIVATDGIGELSLLLPALASLSREGRWIAMVTPPYLPYAPSLTAAGVALANLLLIRAASAADSLWAMEQALRSGSCGAVLAWPAGAPVPAVRRLQLAAESGGGWAVWFTPARQSATTSGAALRLHLAAVERGLQVRVIKRRGGGLPPPLVFPFPSTGGARLPAALQ